MKKNCSSLLLYACLAAASAGLILFPQEVSDSVKSGLMLCTDRLLPTLFPFLILSGFIVHSGAAERIGNRFSRLSQPLFHLPGSCFTAFLIGAVGGYPTGAKSVVELYRSGALSRQEAEHALAFCSNCGPGFLIGTVGFELFRNQKLGLFLYLTHIAAAVLTGILLAPSKSPKYVSPCGHACPQKSCITAFVSSVTDAMGSFLNLSAFILCFSAILSFIRSSGLPSILAAPLPLSGQNGGWFLLGLLEMSGCIFHITNGTLAERLILISALVSWGGFSVHCQILSLLQDTGLSTQRYWTGKLMQPLLSVLLIAAAAGLRPPYCTATALTSTVLFYLVKKAVAKKEKVYYN